MTTAPVSIQRPPAPPTQARGPGLRGLANNLGFLLPALPLTSAGLAVTLTLFATGVGTLIIYAGFFLLFGALYAGRGLGTLELTRLRSAGCDLGRPRWAVPGRPGIIGAIRTVLGSGQYWRFLLHGMLINPLVGIFTWSLTVTWLAAGLGGSTYWLWFRFLPGPHDNDWHISE
ncbi:sensor domain-containing protein [Specibacter sp. RAF43]|uniref:sensor domain-containing protein n=1 Tax=Specibacter sp. RAF43 TaxID=3233057 RepID=UPI003F9B75E4